MIPLEHALLELLADVVPGPAERIRPAEAVGRVLAEDLRADAAFPPRSLALRAGWAVCAAETIGASPYGPLPLPGSPVAVRAGDTLPPGADAVVPPEAVTLLAGMAELTAEASPGEGARRTGEDIAAGSALRCAGARVRATDAAITAAVGLATASVRRVRVAVVAAAHAKPAGNLVAAFARDRGASASLDTAANLDALELAASAAEAVALVGFDEAGAAALGRAGRLIADGLGLRPADAAGAGVLRGSVPVVLVPARVEAAFAASRCVLGPCLDGLLGTHPEPARYSGPLTRKISSSAGIAELALVRAVPHGLEPIGVADLTLHTLAQADGWLLVPAEREGYAAGEVVRAFAV